MSDTRTTEYFHSVHLLEDKCKGCVNCIRHCPTEAIRVREGKAHIIEAKCTDCGECVRNCPNQAKIVVADSLEDLKKFKFNVAMPAPALYGQFPEGTKQRSVLNALLSIGFDYVVDVAFGADLVAARLRDILDFGGGIRPMISPACPAVVRLIQVRFPNLIDNLIPVISPMRMSSIIARDIAKEQFGMEDSDVGIWFITPCPGKVSAIHDPAAYEDSSLNGAIPITDVYPLMREIVLNGGEQAEKNLDHLVFGSGLGIGWGRSGGENQSIGTSRQISVDGISNVIKILDDVESGKLSDIDYIEAQACTGGCVGGVLAVENNFITRRRIRLIATEGEDKAREIEESELAKKYLANERYFMHGRKIEPRPTLKLDDDMEIAIRKMEKMRQILDDLPGLDCGSCGSPNCQALAEDVVRGLATEMDCVFKLRERVRELAGEMIELAEKAPPAMGDKKSESKNAAGDGGKGTETVGKE